MKRLLGVLSMSLVLTGLLFAAPSHALQMTFFGEDLGLGEGTRLTSHPFADDARTDFFSYLVGVGTEDFESFSNGATSPLLVDFGAAGSATLLGNGSIGNVPTGTNSFGRFPISGDQYWESSSQLFALEFSDPVAAFGFYGIDFGDFNGEVMVTASNGVSTTYSIGHTVGAPGGSVLYWGVIDTDNLFTSITFSNSGSSADYFGFDDFSIGSREQVLPTPEPATMLLMGFGLIGLAGLRRRVRE